MSRNRIIGIVLIVVGAVVSWQGWQMKQSMGSQLSQALQGSPSSQSMWMLAIGAVVFVVGAVLVARN